MAGLETIEHTLGVARRSGLCAASGERRIGGVDNRAKKRFDAVLLAVVDFVLGGICPRQ